MRSGWVGFLKCIAWINLIISFIAAICIFIAFGKTEVTEGVYYPFTREVTNWTAVGIGIGLMFESILALAFFMVIAHIAENAENINYYLDKIERISKNFDVSKESSPNSITSGYYYKTNNDYDKWECPKCYYKNPNTVYICENCSYHLK